LSNKSLFYSVFTLFSLSLSSSALAVIGVSGSQSPSSPTTFGTTSTYSITVLNTAADDVVRDNIIITIGDTGNPTLANSISSNDCTILTGGAFSCPDTLAVGDQATFDFTYTPPAVGTYNPTFDVDCMEGVEGPACETQSTSITTVVQAAPGPGDGWPELSGLTDSEQEVYASLQSACSALGLEVGEEERIIEGPTEEARPAGAAADELLAVCSGLISSSSSEIASAIGKITPKQIPAQGTSSIEVYNRQFDNIKSRMAALRRGTRGFSASGLSLHYKGFTLDEKLLAGGSASGGSAGAEEDVFHGKLGVFINGSISFGDKDTSSNETGFDFDTKGVTLGADYRFTDKFVLGGAIGYVDNETDFSNDSGNMDVDGYTLSVYGTYYHSAETYIDVLASIGRNDFSSSRKFDLDLSGIEASDIDGDTEGNEYALSIGAGYDFNRNGFSFGPYGRISYIKAEIDGYSEDGTTGMELVYESQDVESLTLSLGGQVSYAISTTSGVFVPQLRAEYGHESQDDSRFITARFLDDPSKTSFRLHTDDPDKNFVNLGLGLTATFAEGRSAFIYYEALLLQEDVNQSSIAAGVRLAF
jgi:outer membrane autotransporter protein